MTPRASCDQVLTAYERAKADVLKAPDEYPFAGRVYTCTRGPRTYVKWQSCNHGTRCQRTFPLAALAAGTTSPKLLTIAVDGAMAPICTAERAWQEVRMGVIFTPASRMETAAIGRRKYCACLGSLEAFIPRLWGRAAFLWCPSGTQVDLSQ